MSSPYNFHLEFTFTDNPVEELNRRLTLLMTTRVGTMPMEREFGMTQDFLDNPSESAKAMFTAELTEKVATFIPEVRVDSVEWVAGEAGSIIPKVVIADG